MKTFDNYVAIASDGEIDLVQPLGFDDNNYFYYEIMLNDTKKIIGDVNYEDQYRDVMYMGNVGYTIYKEYRGNGYAKKALNLLKQILEKHNKDKMVFNINLDNQASKKVVSNFGADFICYRSIPKNNVLYNYNSEHKFMVYEYKLNNTKNK